jgi:hypothetical protein
MILIQLRLLDARLSLRGPSSSCVAESVSVQGGTRYTPASPRVQMLPAPATAFSSQPGKCEVEGDVRVEVTHHSRLSYCGQVL